DILVTIGSHNLLATPSRAMLDDAHLGPLIEEFVHGAGDVSAEDRAAVFRLAWDFVGSSLGGPNDLYERTYLASPRTNRTLAPPFSAAGPRASALVAASLAAGRRCRGRRAGSPPGPSPPLGRPGRYWSTA